MNDINILYFGGYRTALPGDQIIAYRNDQVVGYISWTLKADPLTKQFDELFSVYTLGANPGKPVVSYTLDEAKQVLVDAFAKHMTALGMEIEGPSRKPKAEDINWVEVLLRDLGECKTSKEVDSFMARSARRLKEMVKLERTQVTGPAEKLFKELWAKENPEPEYA